MNRHEPTAVPRRNDPKACSIVFSIVTVYESFNLLKSLTLFFGGALMIFDSLRQFHRSAEKGVPSKEFGAIGYVHPRSEEMRYPHLFRN